MQIDFTGHQVEVTEAIRSYTKKRFERLQRHFQHILTIGVTFTIEKLDQVAKAIVHVPGATLQASAKASDMYAAIDELADKLDRQLIEHHRKQSAHH